MSATTSHGQRLPGGPDARDLQDQVSEAIDTAKCDFFLQRYA
jgi:hypothetical protein